MAVQSTLYGPSLPVSADLTAKYIIQTADASLTNAQVMGSLATGIVKNTTTTGAQSIAIAGADYIAAAGAAGGQTWIGGTASGNGIVLSPNSSQDGFVKFGTITTPSYFQDTTAAIGQDYLVLRGGKNGGGGRQVLTLQNRGSSLADDVIMGFDPVGGSSVSGGASAGYSKTRIAAIFANPNNIDLSFLVGVGGTATEIIRLDGTNTTLNILQNTTVTDGKNFTIGNSTGTQWGGSSSKQGWFGATPAVQQASAANLTNSVTSGGTDNTIADFTDLTIFANSAAAIRNDIYQLARKLKQVNDSLRTYGLLT